MTMRNQKSEMRNTKKPPRGGAEEAFWYNLNKIYGITM